MSVKPIYRSYSTCFKSNGLQQLNRNSAVYMNIYGMESGSVRKSDYL